jgi:hypothetical protein
VAHRPQILRPIAFDQVSTPLSTSSYFYLPAFHGPAQVPEVIKVQQLFLAKDPEVDIDNLEM